MDRDLTSHAAPYLEVANELHGEILRGRYGTDGKLPTEHELMERFGIARQTLRRALQMLRDQGFVHSKQGSGTYVRPRPANQVVLRDLRVRRDDHGYYFDLAAQDWRALRTPNIDRSPAPSRIAERLGASVGQTVLTRTRLMGDPATGTPMQLATSYLPLEVVEKIPVLGEPDTGPGGIYDRLEEAGPRLEWELEFGSQMPNRAQALALDSPIGLPLLVVLLITRQAGRVVEVCERLMSSERVVIRHPLERDAGAEAAHA